MTISDGDNVLHFEGALRAYAQRGAIKTYRTQNGIRIRGKVPTFYAKQMVISAVKKQLTPNATIEHFELVVD